MARGPRRNPNIGKPSLATTKVNRVGAHLTAPTLVFLLLSGEVRCGAVLDATTLGGFVKIFLGERAYGCGGAGAPCPNCNKNPADPDDAPAMPGGFVPDLS